MFRRARSPRRGVAWLVAVVSVLPSILLATQVSAEEADKQSFHFNCSFSHERADDPLVFPNQAGASHLHTFFGNRSTSASSTAASLSGSPSTCEIGADRSAYWVPTLYDDGVKVLAHHTRVYYLAGNLDHAKVRPLPQGLGVLMKDQSYAWWMCAGNGTSTARTRSVPTCGPGHHLVQILWFPDCWDGRRLDSPDHMSHMAYSRNGKCASTHPVPVVQLRMNVHYTKSDGGNVKLAPLANPSVPHADFVNAWDPATFDRLMAACVSSGVECTREQTLQLAGATV